MSVSSGVASCTTRWLRRLLELVQLIGKSQRLDGLPRQIVGLDLANMVAFTLILKWRVIQRAKFFTSPLAVVLCSGFMATWTAWNSGGTIPARRVSRCEAREVRGGQLQCYYYQIMDVCSSTCGFGSRTVAVSEPNDLGTRHRRPPTCESACALSCRCTSLLVYYHAQCDCPPPPPPPPPGTTGN